MNNFMNAISNKFGRVGLIVKKHSPEILISVGIAGTITSTVMACKATTKLSEITDKAKSDIDAIHKAAKEGSVNGEEYTEKDCQKDLTITYVQTGLKIAKLYAPAAIVGGLSIASLIGSHHIQSNRNAALAAAYTTVSNGFKKYRDNVVDRFGKDVDRELKNNIKAEKYEETIVDEKGKEKTVSKEVKVCKLGKNAYSRYFDSNCPDYSKDMGCNFTFLTCKQNYLNNKLIAQGHLFLNEVYDELGFDRIPDGQVVGWVYDAKDQTKQNYVDFGMFEAAKETAKGYEQCMVLDFNCDGVVYNLI